MSRGGRIRTIKPEWRQDKRLKKSGHESRIFSVVLITMADDEGRGRWSDAVMAAEGFEYDPDPVASLRAAVAGLAGWYFHRYEIEEEEYFQILKFQRHQKIDRPTPSRLPKCPDLVYDGIRWSFRVDGSLDESSRVSIEPSRVVSSAPLSQILDPRSQIQGGVGGGERDAKPSNMILDGYREHRRSFRSPMAGAIRHNLDDVFGSGGEATPSLTDAELNTVALKLSEASQRGGRTLSDLARAMARGFLVDPKARSKGWPGSYLAKNPIQYVNAAPSDPSEAEHDDVPFQ